MIFKKQGKILFKINHKDSVRIKFNEALDIDILYISKKYHEIEKNEKFLEQLTDGVLSKLQKSGHLN